MQLIIFESRNEKLAIRNLRSVEVCAVGRDALIPPRRNVLYTIKSVAGNLKIICRERSCPPTAISMVHRFFQIPTSLIFSERRFCAAIHQHHSFLIIHSIPNSSFLIANDPAFLVLLLTVIVPIINTSFIHLCYNAPIIQSIPQPTITLAEELLWNWIKNVFRSVGISRWC